MSLLIQPAGYVGDHQPLDTVQFKFSVCDASGNRSGTSYP